MNVNIGDECLSNYEPHWVTSKVLHESQRDSLTFHATQRSLYFDTHRKNEFYSLKIWPKGMYVCMYVCMYVSSRNSFIFLFILPNVIKSNSKILKCTFLC